MDVAIIYCLSTFNIMKLSIAILYLSSFLMNQATLAHGEESSKRNLKKKKAISKKGPRPTSAPTASQSSVPTAAQSSAPTAAQSSAPTAAQSSAPTAAQSTSAPTGGGTQDPVN